MFCRVQTLPMSKVKLDVTRVVLVFPVVSLVHHHSVQAVSLLLHGHLFVRALDPRLTITQVGLKAPDPLLDLPAQSHQAGRHHLKLQLRHKPWYGHSLAGLSKVSQTLLVCYCFFLPFFLLFTLSSSFILRDVFINLKRCSSTKLPESTDQFPFRR